VLQHCELAIAPTVNEEVEVAVSCVVRPDVMEVLENRNAEGACINLQRQKRQRED
jgi:hypothetical protein